MIKIFNKYRHFILFCISGSLAFCVDFLVLWLLNHFGMNLWFARAIAFLCAATFTWQFNQIITFRDRKARINHFKGWLSYIGLMLIGGFFNYAASMGVLNILTPPTTYTLLIAVACGSLAGLVANFITSNYWFFKKTKK